MSLGEEKGGRIERAVRSILEAVGEDPARAGLLDTPKRVAEMYEEIFAGLALDPLAELERGIEEGRGEMVVLRDISFHSMCEHHLLPFFGVAHVGYLPGEKVVGIGKLVRVVDIFARRPQIQERLTNEVADTIQRGLDPIGVGVVIEATHLCMAMRGTKKLQATVVTSATRGAFNEPGAARTEFFELIRRGGR